MYFLLALLMNELKIMCPSHMIDGRRVQAMVLHQEDRVPDGHVALLRGKTTVIGVRLWSIVLRHSPNLEAVDTTVTQGTVRNMLLQGQLLAKYF
ncbi:hypothetical protein TNCV_834161 [Trichonephila clavipes]|nr:hypothetical protein TNCV_834161 [Trichonephila clavipes]